MQEASSEGGFRQAAIHCSDYSAHDNVVEFSLSRGSFATILLREIMKPQDPMLAGF
jgi:tRNA pseudouridine13 synthase